MKAKRESMPSSVASHTPAMPDVPNAINALLRHVPNPFLLRRKVTTACRSDPYGSLASSSAHQHLVTIMECAYRTSSALHLFRAQTPVVIHEVAHAEQSFGEAVRDRGDSNSGPRAKPWYSWLPALHEVVWSWQCSLVWGFLLLQNAGCHRYSCIECRGGNVLSAVFRSLSRGSVVSRCDVRDNSGKAARWGATISVSAEETSAGIIDRTRSTPLSSRFFALSSCSKCFKNLLLVRCQTSGIISWRRCCVAYPARQDLVFPDSGPESPAFDLLQTFFVQFKFYHLFGLESSTQITDAYTALVFSPDQAATMLGLVDGTVATMAASASSEAHCANASISNKVISKVAWLRNDCEALGSVGEAVIVCVCRRRLGWNLRQQREWCHQEIWRRGSWERAGPERQFPGLETATTSYRWFSSSWIWWMEMDAPLQLPVVHWQWSIYVCRTNWRRALELDCGKVTILLTSNTDPAKARGGTSGDKWQCGEKVLSGYARRSVSGYLHSDPRYAVDGHAVAVSASGREADV
ncbi:hypothetical protein KCU99_g80, partial [Aureobasidium melanogenum]